MFHACFTTKGLCQLDAVGVSELNRIVSASLERTFPLMRIRGEVAQFTKAGSGHWYFALRDAHASVRAVMFRGRSAGLDWLPKEGDQVEVSAVLTLYEPRGDFQLRVESISRSGQGALYESFLARKEKLSKEGLFDAARKRPLPSAVTRVGLVTSMSAAALRDVVVTLTRLAPRLQIRLFPSPVQGADAPARLIQSLRLAQADPDLEVVLLVRGGGSLEDLWAFNDEDLVRAIAGAQKVVVVGVGHETDITLADLAADVRAATPTAAAQEIALQDRGRAEALADAGRLMSHAMSQHWAAAQQQLDLLAQSLRSPREQWQLRQQRFFALSATMKALFQAGLQQRISRAAALGSTLLALNPEAILRRGYAIALDASGQAVTRADAVGVGDGLQIRLSKGQLAVRVQSRDLDESTG